MLRTLLPALAVAVTPAVLVATTAPAAGLAAGPPRALVVYVAPDGAPDATGTVADPFGSIEAARDSLAGQTGTGNRGTVYLRGGRYQANRTVELTGTNHSHVTYAAYPGEVPELTGTTDLPGEDFVKVADLTDAERNEPQWASAARVDPAVADQVWAFDLGAAGIPVGEVFKNGFNWKQQPFAPQLIADDHAETLAQWPNTGAGYVGVKGAVLSVKAAFKGARDSFSDKTADHSQLTYDEMLGLAGPIFSLNGPEAADRYLRWAQPTQLSGDEAETQTNQPVRDIDNAVHETDGWFAGYFGNNYGNDRVRIYSVSEDGVDTSGATGYHIRTQTPTMYASTTKWTQFVVQNVLWELDSAGEYYIDRYRDSDILYYLPAGGTPVGKSLSLTSFDQPFFELEGTTGVTLTGLKLNGTNGDGLRLLDAEDSTISKVEILNTSLDAVKIGQATDTLTALPEYTTSRGGHHNKVIDSKLHDLGGGGVFLAGGNRKTLERGNNVAAHNEIWNFSKLATYTPAGYLYGVGNSFEHNDVHDAPHMAIQIMGNDMTVNHNRFERIVTNAADQGAIYSGRDYTYLGNEIAWNYFGDIQGVRGNQAIYMDDGMSSLHIHHNYFKDMQHGLFYNSGHGNKAYDNVFSGVERVGHDKLYHESTEDLPVDNSWVVLSRFRDMLQVGDGTGFTNTAANVRTWHDHYATAYPRVDDWYIPTDTTTGQPCAVVSTEPGSGCTRDDVWDNPNSVYVPADSVLTSSVLIDTGAFAYTDNTPEERNIKSFNPDFETGLFSVATAAEAGFDEATARFSAQSPLKKVDGFGKRWIEAWNAGFTLDGVGPRR